MIENLGVLIVEQLRQETNKHQMSLVGRSEAENNLLK